MLLMTRADGTWLVLLPLNRLLAVSYTHLLSSRIVILAPHPGRVAHEVKVDLPWPRTGETRESRAFEEMVLHTSRLLRGVSAP